MSDDARLRELAKELPYEHPDEARREAVRASLLAAATRREEHPPQRWRVVAAFGAGALVAAAAVLLVVGRRDPAPAAIEHARIEASAAAALEHTVSTTASGTDEIVRVHSGKVRVAVAAVKAGDRVAIETSDGTVEGAGDYEVAVRDDKLAAVTVTAGSARVVISGQKAVFLAAGQAWHAELWTAEITPAIPAPTTAPSSAPTAPIQTTTMTPPTPTSPLPTTSSIQTPTPTPRPASPLPAVAPAMTTSVPPPVETPTPAPAVTTPTPAVAAPKAIEPTETEQHFQRGWKLLKAGKAIEASAELGLAADGEGPIAIDARYFQAEALVKAGRKTEAEKALVGFLDRATQSLRRGRAAVMLARLIAERGDTASARAWFQAAIGDGDPAVAKAAKAGLAALE